VPRRAAHPTQRPRERLLLCGVTLPGHAREHDGALTEAASLARAAGAELAGTVAVQRRAAPDPATLMGRGKVEEVAGEVERLAPDAVLVDNDLTPAQLRNLERAWKRRVIDRSELILDIFARRAQTQQARLQVELAQTQYLMPRLRRMWTHLERFEGGIGMRGPGETQLETDRRLIKRRIQTLSDELDAIQRRAREHVRTRAERFTVGLVGYTNAGKSTLLNRLTGADEFVADMPFATLDTRTRQWKLADGRTVLLADTVGFLQRLPHHLVASFQTTLEEALAVDVLLHVVDASHADALVQMQAVEDVLRGLPQHRQADLIVFNKIDRLAALGGIDELRGDRLEDAVCVSAATGEGLDQLAARVAEVLDRRSTLVRLEIAPEDGRTLAALRRGLGKVVEQESDANGVVRVRVLIESGALGLLRRSAAPATRVEVLREALGAASG
jgi:GTP-binding protein HflX